MVVGGAHFGGWTRPPGRARASASTRRADSAADSRGRRGGDEDAEGTGGWGGCVVRSPTGVAVAVAVGALVAEVDVTRGGADANAGDVTDRAGVDEGGDGVVLGSAGGEAEDVHRPLGGVGIRRDREVAVLVQRAPHARVEARHAVGLETPRVEERRAHALHRLRLGAHVRAHGDAHPGGQGARGRQRHTGKRGCPPRARRCASPTLPPPLDAGLAACDIARAAANAADASVMAEGHRRRH